MLERLRRKRTALEKYVKTAITLLGLLFATHHCSLCVHQLFSKAGKFLHTELPFELVNKFLTADKLEAVRFSEDEANELVTALQIMHLDTRHAADAHAYRHAQLIEDQVNGTVRSFSI